MSSSEPAHKTHTVDYFKSDTDQSILLEDIVTDNLVTALINMGAELWAYRRRLMVIEQLLRNRGTVTREMIEEYVPSAEVAAEWEREREAFVTNVYGVLARQGDLPPTTEMHWPKTKVKGN